MWFRSATTAFPWTCRNGVVFVIRGPRVVRDGQTLTVYANRRVALLGGLVAVVLIVGGATGFGDGSVEPMDVVGIVLGALIVPSALRTLLSTKPLLVVNAQGISSPFIDPAEVVEWKRVVSIECSGLKRRSLDVRAWHIVGRPKAGSGCPVSIPSLALPVRSGKLIAEMMTYRPED